MKSKRRPTLNINIYLRTRGKVKRGSSSTRTYFTLQQILPTHPPNVIWRINMATPTVLHKYPSSGDFVIVRRPPSLPESSSAQRVTECARSVRHASRLFTDEHCRYILAHLIFPSISLVHKAALSRSVEISHFFTNHCARHEAAFLSYLSNSVSKFVSVLPSRDVFGCSYTAF